MLRLEELILKNLIYNDEYCRKVIPFIKEEYFQHRKEKHLFSEVYSFVNEYKTLPTFEALVICFNEKVDLNETDYEEVITLLQTLHENRSDTVDLKWLIDQTERFCQDRAIYNAIKESVCILDETNTKQKKSKGEIPNLLSNALAVSFDTNIGHDYVNSPEGRYEAYHRKENKVRFDLDMFNRITRGGLSTKTLNVCLAGTGAGKTLLMCHMAAAAISMGYNVLYITMEMSEEKIAERIDANLLDIAIDELSMLSKESYLKKFDYIQNKFKGNMIIKEYPTANASVLHFKALLNELQLKKSFSPDILFVDYLNICSSSRIKPGSGANSYTYVKSIAEEIRGLAVEYDFPVMTATQTTRQGYNSSDVEITDTSESFGLPATADFMFALVTDEALDQMDQVMVKQLKNRYSDPTKNKKFVLGKDKSKMRLYDLENEAQEDIHDSGQDFMVKNKDDKYNKLKVV